MRRVLHIAIGFSLVTGLVWLGQFAIDDRSERRMLLAVNPAETRPLLDAAVLLLTDFSIPTVGVVLAAWLLGYAAWARGVAEGAALRRAFLLAGALVGVAVAAVLTPGYEQRVVPWLVIPFAVGAFGLAGASFSAPAPQLRRAARLIGVMLLCVALTEAAMELIDTFSGGRLRPLHSQNTHWNGALRILEDEKVQYGTSYVSGHAAGLFALLTPLFWTTRRPGIRVALLLWGTAHAWSRVYVAAHYPYCVLMGSLLGIGIASWVVWSLAPTRRETPRAQPTTAEAAGAAVPSGS